MSKSFLAPLLSLVLHLVFFLPVSYFSKYRSPVKNNKIQKIKVKIERKKEKPQSIKKEIKIPKKKIVKKIKKTRTLRKKKKKRISKKTRAVQGLNKKSFIKKI